MTWTNFTQNIEKFCGDGQKLWDQNLTVYTDSPDLTECFQHTLLVWIPVIFLFLFTPLVLYQILTSKRLPLPWTWLNVLKMILCLCLAVDTGAMLFYSVDLWRSQNRSVPLGDFVTPLLLCLSMLNLFLMMVMCKAKGLITSGVMWLSWLLFTIFGVVEFSSHIRKLANGSSPSIDSGKVSSYIIYYVLVVVELILHSFADKTTEYRHIGKEKLQHLCPENESSFLSQLTFWWFNPLAILGWRQPIKSGDLWGINELDSSPHLVPIWERCWFPAVHAYHAKKSAAEATFEQEVRAGLHPIEESTKLLDGNGEIELVSKDQTNGDKTAAEVMLIDPKPSKKKGDKKAKKEKVKTPGPKLPPQPSIVWPLFLCFKWLFIPGTVYKLIADTLQFASPQILRLLINFVQAKDPKPPIWIGMFYAALLLVVAIIYSLLLHQYFHLMFRAGMNIRTVLVSAVFKKSLLLSNAARKTKQVGEIVNLMSTDAQRFMDVAPYLNALWSAPYQIALSLYFLWQILGPSVLAGVAVMILLIPLNGFVASKQRSLQVQQMKFKDERIKLMNEVLNGMKVLKLYAWEPPFEEEITKIRQEELKVLRKASYLSAFGSFTWICAPFLVALVTFTTFVLVDENNILTPTVAFVSLSLFNILRFPLTMLPMMITFIVQASVSNQRLKSFLTADEIEPDSVTHNANETDPVVIRNGNFAWDKTAKTPALSNINLSIPTGSLIAVVGTVGSGKSSLVSAILGEMDKMEIDGKKTCVVNTKGHIAYVPQQAWVQNSTLRDNITFARSYDQSFYQKVIDSCALQPDLDILPGGDTTEIGEKGINLSGGQKQRVSLARAVYQDADTYLLDDPLSAVDSHVGKHIFEQVISHNGLLKSKTRILVTHGLTYLKHVDRIVVMKKGEISEIGSYEELIRNGDAFAEFLETYLTQKATADQEDSDYETDDNVADLLKDIEKIAPNVLQRLESQLSTVSSHEGTALPRQDSHQTSPVKRTLTDRSVSRSPPSSVRGKKMSPDRQPSKKEHKGDEKPQKIGTTLMEVEKVETGKVKSAVYFMYVRAVGYLPAVIICIMFVGSQGFSVGTNLWLSEWSNAELARANATSTDDLDKWLGGYGGIGVGQALCVFLGSLISSYAMVQASAHLHKTMLHNLMRSPISFYDVTPLGRIVNRCGKDVDVVDNTIPQNLRSWIQCVISVVATLCVIVASTPIFAVVIVPLGVVYFFVQRFYVATSRQLKRLESVSRSPIYSHFQETITGAPSIRAYGVQQSFMLTSQQFVDNNQSSYYPNIASNRWLAVRLEFVGNCIVFFAAMFAVLARDDDVSAGIVGLSITYALSITQTLNWAVRMTSDLETNIVAVERIKEYSETPTEAEWESSYNKPDPSWPAVGRIEFDKLEIRYRPGLDLVLKGINCDVSGGEKIGIVGRTGAGKSSLTLALFRMVEAAGGHISIDGVNVAQIGLHDLRRKLTIIPQEPVLFSGTLRLNLDPFNQYSDEQLWNVLELSHLKEFVTTLPDRFEHKITEGGDNLSVGQKQLVCLARALLRKTKLLILDEATAAVDLETDDLIQKTIRLEFQDSTVLTIAHRLNTIMDSNRVLVLDKGQIVEFDSPEALLANRNGIFYGMAKDAGLV